MKTEDEFYQAIIKITLSIECRFPEMSKYLGEAPMCIHPSLSVNLDKLRIYHNSIETFMIYYARYQQLNNSAPEC